MSEESTVPVARVQGLSSMATRRLLADLSSRVSQRLGIDVNVVSAGGVEIAQRIRSGTRADFIVLADGAVASLANDDLVVRESVVPLFRSSVAVAVPDDAPDVDIATQDSLRAAVVDADKIGYSTGPSGTAIMHLFESWGLTEQLKGRLVQAAPGVPVAKLLATHEVDLGFQQRSELIGATGVRVLGSMPPGTQVTTTFSGAVLSSAEEADLARRVLDALSEDSRRGVTTSHGMEPILDV